MELSQRYKQAAKEARWSLSLAIFYVIGWCVCAYLPKDSGGRKESLPGGGNSLYRSSVKGSGQPTD